MGGFDFLSNKLAKPEYQDTASSFAGALSIGADMLIDMTAQIIEVEVTGWQDYSSGSPCRCDFKFRDPNYCD